MGPITRISAYGDCAGGSALSLINKGFMHDLALVNVVKTISRPAKSNYSIGRKYRSGLRWRDDCAHVLSNNISSWLAQMLLGWRRKGFLCALDFPRLDSPY